jgi:hypothetical protein
MMCKFCLSCRALHQNNIILEIHSLFVKISGFGINSNLELRMQYEYFRNSGPHLAMKCLDCKKDVTNDR